MTKNAVERIEELSSGRNISPHERSVGDIESEITAPFEEYITKLQFRAIEMLQDSGVLTQLQGIQQSLLEGKVAKTRITT